MIAFVRTPKAQVLLILTGLLSTAGVLLGWQTVLPALLAGVLGACASDLLIARGMTGRWRVPTSALISGLIVASVLGTETPWPVTTFGGFLASLSKWALRTRRGHIFNPAALALLVAIPLFAAGESWWGALADLPAPWILALLLPGAFLTYRLNKFPLALAFLGTLFSLFTGIGLVHPVWVADVFRPPLVETTLYLALFMLTDPPTSPGRVRDQIWVGALAGLVSSVAFRVGAGQSYLLIGLLCGNGALFWHRLVTSGRAVRRPEPSAVLTNGVKSPYDAEQSEASSLPTTYPWRRAFHPGGQRLAAGPPNR